jgi:hypothetical protein
MASFSTAFTRAASIVQGQNGENKYSTSEDKRVDAFNLLVRDSSNEDIKIKVNNMFTQYTKSGDIQVLHDIFVLAFHKRSTSKKDVCDGEGFKMVFYLYILELFNVYPTIVCELFRCGIVAVYGYWKDYLNIWKLVNELEMPIKQKYDKYNPLIQAIREGILNQRREDTQTIREYCRKNSFDFDFSTVPQFQEFIKEHPSDFNGNISMVGKYCVRESSSFNRDCYWFKGAGLEKETHVAFMCRTLLMKPSSGTMISDNEKVPMTAFKRWRIVNSKLNIVLDVPEVKFCSGKWAELKISRIPSVCFHRHTKALLNEKLKENPNNDEDDTGNRFPDIEDRVSCRNNVIEHISNGGKINVSALLPNEIIGDFDTLCRKSTLDKKLMEIKWNLLLEETRVKMATISAELAYASTDNDIRKSFALGNMLCVADVSGSMFSPNSAPNRPIDISVSLAAFCSQLASPHYRDLVMTFSSDPKVVNLRDCNSLQDRIDTIKHIEWGMSTNYEEMHRCLINVCKSGNVPEEELPVLVIFTDGEFNRMVITSCGNKDTAHKKVVKMWTDAGYTKVPTMCYWNLAANRNGVQAKANEKGIFFLQGPSPSNIRFVLYGEGVDETEVTETIDGEKVTYKTADIDPYTIFRKAMDQDYFKPIINIVDKLI